MSETTSENENKYDIFLEIVTSKNNNEEIEPDILSVLIEICKTSEIDSKSKGVNLLILVIYGNLQNCFDILIERGYDYNCIINDGPNLNMSPIIWAIHSQNDYYMNKLLSFEEINLFPEPYNDVNIITHLCENIYDIERFKKIIYKMVEKDKEKTVELITRMRRNFIVCCLFNYNLTLDKDLLFDKIDIILNIDYRLVRTYSVIYFFKDILQIKDKHIKNISVKLYQHLRDNYFKPQIIHPIIYAALYNNLEFIKLLNEKYQDCYLDEKDLITPLNIAIKNNYKDIIDYLIKNGCDIFSKSEKGFSLNIFNPKIVIEHSYDNLYYCITNDNLELFKYLTKKGFDMFQEYEFNNEIIYLSKYFRPIHVACAYKSMNIILYLIEQGENLIYNGNCKLSPLDVAKKNNLSILDINILSSDIKTIDYYIKDNKSRLVNECCICLESAYNKSLVKLKCGHIFHKDCLLTNLKNNNTCPYCRSNVEIDYFVNTSLGEIKTKKYKKLKRTKSLNNYQKKKTCIPCDKKILDTNLDNLEIEKINPRDLINERFMELMEKIQNNNRVRQLIELKKYLLKSKCISKRNKITRIYNTPPPTPIKIKRKFRSEVEKLKEIYINKEENINYKRKSRSKQPERYGFSL